MCTLFATPRAGSLREMSDSAVLVVEDDFAIRRLVSMVLRREGYRVETASDGAEAGAKLGVDDFDVIVLDLMMPRLDGFTLMRSIAEKDPARLRRIIVTSAASRSVIDERLHGIDIDLLPKPFDISELAARVRTRAGAFAES